MHHFVLLHETGGTTVATDGYYGETDPELYGPDGRAFYVKAHNSKAYRAFANNKWDSGEGVLLLSRKCFVPVYDPNLQRPRFSEHELFLPELPELSSKVVCEVSRGPRNRFFAERWTPKRLWLLADEQFTMHRIVNGVSSRAWEGYGILDLSSYFPSRRWEDDGTIWRSNDGSTVYRLSQVDFDHRDRDFDVPPVEDPRLPLEWLPEEFHDLSMLPDE